MKLKIITILLLLLGFVGCKKLGGPSVELLTLDYDHLVAIKKGIYEKSPEYLAAYQRLLKEADIALNRPCYSVIHKESLPPSGDKKDYMSLATYWWPDPEQPDGLPYIRKDGYRNPEGNTRRFDDRSSLNMVNDVTTLTLAWFHSNNQEYSRKAVEMLDVWFLQAETSMNPNLEFGQSIPGKVDGRGVGIIDTRNYIKIIDAVKLLERGQFWNQRKTKKLRQWFSSYAEWLQQSGHGKDEQAHENNHGTWYDVQLACYADFIGDTDLAREVISRSAFSRIDRQIDSQGRQELELARTRAYRYSVMNLHAYALLAKMGEKYGINLWEYQSQDEGSLKKACDFIFSYMDHFEDWPYQQITEVEWSSLIPLASECSRKFNDPIYDAYLQRLENKVKPTDRLIITKL